MPTSRVALGIVPTTLARIQIDRNTFPVTIRIIRTRVARGVYAIASVQEVCPYAAFKRVALPATVERILAAPPVSVSPPF